MGRGEKVCDSTRREGEGGAERGLWSAGEVDNRLCINSIVGSVTGANEAGRNRAGTKQGGTKKPGTKQVGTKQGGSKIDGAEPRWPRASTVANIRLQPDETDQTRV